MTSDEFTEWLNYHCGAFTNLRDWLNKMGRDQTEETLRHWRRTLSGATLEHAKAATEALFSGDEAEPKSRDKIPAAVAAIARKLKRAWNEANERRTWRPTGEETVKCPGCLDVGWRICWHPATMEDCAAGKFPGDGMSIEGTGYTCAVPCTCEAGDNGARRLKYRFSPDRWCELTGPRYSETEEQFLVDFVRARTGAAW